MGETDDMLRDMARHRGLKLAKSRRRKPGGDFGLYGLKDMQGGAVFGIGADGFTADAAAIEAYLRDTTRATWSSSAEAEKAAPRVASKAPAKPQRRPKPAPAPKPRPKLQVPNLLRGLPAAKRAEAFTELLARPGVQVERIVSQGQATPEDAPMVQDWDEWVLLLEGAAGIRLGDSAEAQLARGDHLCIPAGTPHWVTWTAKDRPTIWLALHLGRN